MASSSNELSALEKELFKFTLERNFDEVKRLITVENISVDCTDDDGMTPLQHAAYKGDYKLCKLLLDCGANVNLTRHSSQYSALTFAGLSGKVDVVNLLLEYGASTSSVNSINKTAAQMAAFVGNHNVVSAINNFIPIEDVAYFTKVRGLEKEPKLPPFLLEPVHKMAILTNIHPVRLVIFIQNNISILENAQKVIKVFNIMSEKQIKNEGNELLSLKFHHLAFILIACESFVGEQKSKLSETDSGHVKNALNQLIRSWLKGDDKGFPVVLEKLLRQDVREYPYVECSLFQQLVRTLAPVKIGDEPSAISIVNEAVNGQRGLEYSTSCATCGEPNPEKKCSACKFVQYCGKNCQKLHWFTHKNICQTYAKKLKEVSGETSKSKNADSNADAEQTAEDTKDAASCDQN